MPVHVVAPADLVAHLIEVDMHGEHVEHVIANEGSFVVVTTALLVMHSDETTTNPPVH